MDEKWMLCARMALRGSIFVQTLASECLLTQRYCQALAKRDKKSAGTALNDLDPDIYICVCVCLSVCGSGI